MHVATAGDSECELDEGCNSAAITAAAQHKVLVFAQQALMLDLLEQQLLKPVFPRCTYLRIDGMVLAAAVEAVVSV